MQGLRSYYIVVLKFFSTDRVILFAFIPLIGDYVKMLMQL